MYLWGWGSPQPYCRQTWGLPTPTPWMQTPLEADPLDAEPPGGRPLGGGLPWMQTPPPWSQIHPPPGTPPGCFSAPLNWASPNQITRLLCSEYHIWISINHFNTCLSSTFTFQFGPGLDSYKVLEVPDYKSLTAPPDPCEVNGAVNVTAALSTLGTAILATFLVWIQF